MARLRVSGAIPAPPAEVWADIRDISSHVEWMADAVAIRFTSAEREGIGTSFDCDTKVGPLRLTDRMEITEWEPAAVMGIRHVGLVTGTGRFTLEPSPDRATTFVWEERLVFPWFMGGPVGAFVGAVVLKRVWRSNLGRLSRRFSSPPNGRPLR